MLTTEQRLEIVIGKLQIANASLSAQLEESQAKLAEAEKPKDKPKAK